MPFSFALPGLFDFTTGRTSAINQRLLGARADSAQSRSFVDQLNAFNTGLNTNDNLEFRRGFAEQPQGTSILDRFNSVAATSTNPFVTNQALLQGQANAPLLFNAGLQSPGFGTSQGLPATAQAGVSQGFGGIGAILQQQYNQQLPALMQTNNPGVDANTLLANVSAQLAMSQSNTQQAGLIEQLQEQRKINSDLQLVIRDRLGVSNSPGNVAASTGAPVNNNLGLVGGTGDDIFKSRLITEFPGTQ